MAEITILNPALQGAPKTLLSRELGESETQYGALNDGMRSESGALYGYGLWGDVGGTDGSGNGAGEGGFLPCAGLLEEGTLLCGKYTVEKRLEVASGEADLYLCSSEGESYVAKLYQRKTSVKQEVTDRLLLLDSPYVARLFEASSLEGYPLEIIKYYKNGSLQGRTYSLEELTRVIIPCINEGLYALHQAGILSTKT